MKKVLIILIIVGSIVAFFYSEKAINMDKQSFSGASNAFRSMMDQADKKEAEKNWKDTYFNINSN